MTKEKIFQQIENLIRPKFENETTVFKKLLLSPYHPMVVVEYVKRVSTKRANVKEKATQSHIWRHETMHLQIHHFEGAEKLYQKYLKAS